MSDSFSIGDPVWAKLKGFCPWPGKITEPPEGLKCSKKKSHCVYFFGTNNYAFVELIALKPYEQYKDKLIKNQKSSQFKDALTAMEKYLMERFGKANASGCGDQAFDSVNDTSCSDNNKLERTIEKIKERNAGGVTALGTDFASEKKASTKRKRKPKLEEFRGDELLNQNSKLSYFSASEELDDISDFSLDHTPTAKRPLIHSTSAKRSSLYTTRPTDQVCARPRMSSVNYSAFTAGSEYADDQLNHVNGSRAAAPNKRVSSLLHRSTFVNRLNTPTLDLKTVSDTLKEKNITASELRFGVIGLGAMGCGIVKNLLNSKHTVYVWNRSSDKCEDFVNVGAHKSLTPSDVVSAADIIISSVSNPQVAKEVMFGNCGVLQEIDDTKAYVEMTSVDSETSKDMMEAIALKGGRYLEAQLQGNRGQAELGMLVLLCAGDRSLFDDCQTCFQAIGKNSYYLGEVGNASRMNLVLQLLHAVQLAGFSEAMALADRAGLRQNDVLDVLSLTNYVSPLILDKGSSIVQGSFDTQMALKHLQKDLHLCLTMSESLEQPLPLTATTNEIFKHAKRLGYADHDESAVYISSRF